MGERIEARTFDKPLNFVVDGKAQHANWTWYRGEHCNFNPAEANMLSSRSIVDHVLAGWLPEEPAIGPDTKISAFGSCFAEHISTWLSERRYSVVSRDPASVSHLVRMGEGMVNSFALAEQFRWALDGERYDGSFWHGYDAEAFGYSEDIRQATRRILLETDVFIITFGLSEIWYDTVTGGVFWRAVPSGLFDPGRHKFRVATFQENKDNILSIYRAIRTHRPGARIIFTMSPIPLVATFRPVSCITANSASKALLRGAIDEAYREVAHEGALSYWPSYEIVLDAFDRRWVDDRRHVREPVLDYVMTLFEHFWCFGTKPRMSIPQAWAIAMSATGALPLKVGLHVKNGDRSALEELARKLAEKDATRAQADTIRRLLDEL